MRRRQIALALVCLSVAGCTVGPNYQRPKVDVPPGYRGPQANPAGGAPAGSLGNEKWWAVYHDPVLQQLIHTAIQQNYDVRIAATRVVEAQAQLRLTRSNQFPMVGTGAEIFSLKNPKLTSAFPAYEENVGQLDLSVIWNLDFWGKYRRETEAARDSVLASEWGRRAVISSVVSSVATAYFQLRELDVALDISRRTLASRQDSLKLTQVLVDHGSASQLDLRQAQELVATAAETIPDLERQVRQQEDLISDLVGENPQPIARGLALIEQPVPLVVPAGIPSELLERRPDIREAEANLMAANANIGVAKASFFPNLSLTATGGLESYALNRLFTGAAGLWNAAASASQPVFQAGALHAGLNLTTAQQQQMLLSYQQTIKEAFREVADALIAYQKYREYLEQQQVLTDAAQDADRLSKVLYQHGGVSYLQVLTSETNYFAAELNLAQAQLNQRLALVQLYNSLGGGWEQ
jgi:multidrug efflux system outer membrane protein